MTPSLSMSIPSAAGMAGDEYNLFRKCLEVKKVRT